MNARYLTRILTAAVLGGSALTVAACGDGAGPAADATVAPIPGPAGTKQSPTPAELGDGAFPAVTEADRSSADSTAETAARIMHSWDTTMDRTETAAAIRAVPLMSADWAANQVEPQRNSSQGDWLRPAEHQAYSLARAVPATGDVARDIDGDKAVRAYDVTWSWVARDGTDLTDTGRRQITLYLEKHQGQWQVVGHQLRDMPTTGDGGGR